MGSRVRTDLWVDDLTPGLVNKGPAESGALPHVSQLVEEPRRFELCFPGMWFGCGGLYNIMLPSQSTGLVQEANWLLFRDQSPKGSQWLS